MDITQEQIEYRQSEPSKLGRGIERLTHPVGKAIAKVAPKGVVKGAFKQIDAATTRPFIDFTHDTDDLDAARKAAQKVENTARGINASTGAAAGLGGVWTMGADIPATIAIAMRNIRDTGRAYGFEGDGEEEKAFRLRVLELAATDGGDPRQALIAELEAEITDTGDLRASNNDDITPLVDQIIERVSRAMALTSVRKRFGMVVPLLGSAIGGYVNASFQRDVSQAARFAFQERKLRAQAGRA